MQINELRGLVDELRQKGMTNEEINEEIRRRMADEVDDEDEVECGYDRPIAGVPLPPLDLMIDSCGL